MSMSMIKSIYNRNQIEIQRSRCDTYLLLSTMTIELELSDQIDIYDHVVWSSRPYLRSNGISTDAPIRIPKRISAWRSTSPWTRPRARIS